LDSSSFGLIWLSLLLGPPLALACFIAARRTKARPQNPVLIGSAATLGIVVGAIIFRIAFALPIANTAAVSIAYVAYCFLTFSCWRIHRRILRYSLTILFSFPVLVGYFTATVGILGLAFIMGDYTAAPKTVEIVKPGLSCVTNVWGNAISDEGYTIHLYRVSPSFPFIRWEVRKVTVDETDPGSGPRHASCADVVKIHDD
jgi:hypothetical protein